jgi:hypothetical protein
VLEAWQITGERFAVPITIAACDHYGKRVEVRHIEQVIAVVD